MDHTLITTLPSNFYPYPEDVKILCRGINYGESHYFSEKHKDELALISKFQRNEIIVVEGMEFEDITVGDWLYLLLTVMSSSFLELSYNLAKTCPKCKGEIKTIKLEIPGAPKLEVKGELKKRVKPSEINFIQLEESDGIEGPAIIDLGNGTEVCLDFYRLKHYIQKVKNPDLNELTLMMDRDLMDLSFEEVQYVGLARKMMDHGTDDEFMLKCPMCQHEEAVEFKWRGLDFIPFRIEESSVKRRVRFSKRSSPGHTKSKETSVSSSRGSLPRFNKVSNRSKRQDEES